METTLVTHFTWWHINWGFKSLYLDKLEELSQLFEYPSRHRKENDKISNFYWSLCAWNNNSSIRIRVQRPRTFFRWQNFLHRNIFARDVFRIDRRHCRRLKAFLCRAIDIGLPLFSEHCVKSDCCLSILNWAVFAFLKDIRKMKSRSRNNVRAEFQLSSQRYPFALYCKV